MATGFVGEERDSRFGIFENETLTAQR